MTRRKGLISLIIAILISLFGCNSPKPYDNQLIIMENKSEVFINIKEIEEADWFSDNESVVTVLDTKAGYLHLKSISEGVAVIKQKNSSAKTYRVQVRAENTNGIKLLSGNNIYINLSEDSKYQVELVDVSTKNLETFYDFQIEDLSYATVSASGIVSAKKVGVTRLTIKEKKTGLVRQANIIISGDISMRYSREVDTGGVGTPYHIQGFTTDTAAEYFYYSFTDRLIKQDCNGNIIGSVIGFDGHLGDVCFNEADGRVYSAYMSLYEAGDVKLPTHEYTTGRNAYVLIFDVDKITELDMSPENIVTSVYIGQPIVELASQNGYGQYGDLIQLGGKYGVWNNIDSITFGPEFGKSTGEQYLTLGLGMPSNSVNLNGVYANYRTDNDYITLVQFDTTDWKNYEISYQMRDNGNGPQTFDKEAFYYMGFHDYGIQNLDYDKFQNSWILTAYGVWNKTGDVQFPNYVFFMLDAENAQEEILKGNGEEKALVLRAKYGLLHQPSGVKGYSIDYSVGFRSMGSGYYYSADNYNTKHNGQGAIITLHKWAINSENINNAQSPFISVN